MKRLFVLSLMFCLGTASGWAAAAKTSIRTPVEVSDAAAGAQTIEIRIPNANLEVVGGPGPGVRAAGTMETLHKDPQRARLLSKGCGLAFRREGTVLVLEPRTPEGALGREARKGRLWFHLRLEVPSTLPVGLYSRAGDMVLRGEFRASLIAEAGRGDIRLAFLPGFREMDARTLIGRVRGFPDTALPRFYSPLGQRRLWLNPAGSRMAFFRTRRGNIILQGKDTQ